MKKSLLLLLSCMLCGLLFLSACSEKTSKFTTFDLYNQTADPVPYMLTDGKTAGAYVNTSKAFCGFEVTLTTVDEAENRVMLAVYRYDTDYVTSIAGSPVSAGIFENVKAGERLYLQFEDLPAGRYILTVTAEGASVGIHRQASLPSVETLVHFYYHHLRLESGAFPFSGTFRTSAVKGLSSSDVFTLPDYSWQVETEPTTDGDGTES